jgi:Endomembrane protein 70
MFGGGSWVRNVLLTATLFCGPLLVTFSFLNTVAIAYRSTAALPFGTICIIVVIWVLVSGQLLPCIVPLWRLDMRAVHDHGNIFSNPTCCLPGCLTCQQPWPTAGDIPADSPWRHHGEEHTDGV